MDNPSSKLLLWWVVLIYCVAGVLDDQGRCETNPLEECGFDMSESTIPWNLRQRKVFCRNVQRYYECANKEEYPINELCGWSLVLHNAQDLIDEFCGESSPLRTSYMRAAKCFRDHLNQHVRDCIKRTDATFKMYQKYSKEGKLIARDADVVRCIKGVHRMECLAIKIDLECGNDAYNTFKVILTKSKYHLLSCKDSSDVEVALNIAAEISEGLLDNRYPRSEIFL